MADIGEYCTLVAYPDNLQFEMVEIFGEKEMFFTLKNLSSSGVTANLRLMHEEWTEWSQSMDLFGRVKVRPTRVILGGNESKEISVKVRPDRTNFQKYFIQYSVELAETKDGDKYSPVNYRNLCDLSFIGDHAVFKVTDSMMIARHPFWDAEQCWAMFSLDRLNEYLVPLRNTAPEGKLLNVRSVEFRFPSAPLDSDSAIVTILLSNAEQLRGYWEIYTKPPKNWAQRTRLHRKDGGNLSNFGKGAERDKQMLSKIWDIKLNKEETQAMTRKQEEGQGDNGYSVKAHLTWTHAQTQNIECFKIAPTRGVLNSRESQQICFRYSYKCIGTHCQFVLLRIQPAIFIWIELRGTTFQENEPSVQLIEKDFLQLHPVCLSNLDPPIQMLWVFNGGNAPANFTVDPEPFEKIRNTNFGHEVFECVSYNGFIPPCSWYPVLLRFSPLELQEYTITVNINFDNWVKEVLIKGQAVLTPEISLRPPANGDKNRKYSLIDPLVPVTISPTHVTFPHLIPNGQTSTSIVFLTNLSAKKKISFTWPTVPIEGGGSIQFVPDAGIIRPKEQAAIMVNVIGGRVSTVFSRMVRCSMIDETSLAEFEFVNKAWEFQKGSLVKSMTEAEAEQRLVEKLKLNGKPVRPQSFSRVLSVKAFIGSVFGTLDTVMPKEQQRMPFADTMHLTRTRKNKLTLLPFGRQLCREILSDMLWDVVNSSSFSSQVKRLSTLRAPYKGSKMSKKRKIKKEKEPLVSFPIEASQDILEHVIFNLIQEVAEDFYPGKTNHTIKPVQPQELIDVKQYCRDLV